MYCACMFSTHVARKGSAPQDNKPCTSQVDDDLVVVQSGEPILVPKTPDSGPGLASHVGCWGRGQWRSAGPLSSIMHARSLQNGMNAICKR